MFEKASNALTIIIFYAVVLALLSIAGSLLYRLNYWIITS